ncbi:MAG: hypothetical protein U1F26_04170 [Lysobacterales bacterium]
MSVPMRIAMWSGPRNISTAMMRAWENRGDCVVSDEPLYAHYLAATGVDHPGREEVIATGDTDWRRVVAALTGPIPDGQPLWYQKHMCHHLLPGMDLDWIDALHNVLLIRDPADVVASYLRTRDQVTAADIGIPQQAALYQHLCERGTPPPIVDAGEFLRAPAAHLRALCDRLGIPYTTRMLHWPAGPRASDGIWAKHWYHAVWQSTGFQAAERESRELSPAAADVVAHCQPLYARLYAERLRA